MGQKQEYLLFDWYVLGLRIAQVLVQICIQIQYLLFDRGVLVLCDWQVIGRSSGIFWAKRHLVGQKQEYLLFDWSVSGVKFAAPNQFLFDRGILAPHASLYLTCCPK